MDPRTQAQLTDTGRFLIRAVLAVVFIFHGSQKLFGWFGGGGIQGTAGFFESVHIPFPLLGAYVSGIVEFFGGIVLLLGTGTRIAAALLAINMFVAILSVHRGAFSLQHNGMEYALTLLVVFVALVLIGPGRFTVGQLLTSKPQQV